MSRGAADFFPHLSRRFRFPPLHSLLLHPCLVAQSLSDFPSSSSLFLWETLSFLATSTECVMGVCFGVSSAFLSTPPRGTFFPRDLFHVPFFVTVSF